MTSSSTLYGLTLSNLVRDEQSHQGHNVQFKGDGSSLLSPTQVQSERDKKSTVNLMDIIAKAIAKHLSLYSNNGSTNVPPFLGVTGVELVSGLEIHNTACSSKE